MAGKYKIVFANRYCLQILRHKCGILDKAMLKINSKRLGNYYIQIRQKPFSEVIFRVGLLEMGSDPLDLSLRLTHSK